MDGYIVSLGITTDSVLPYEVWVSRIGWATVCINRLATVTAAFYHILRFCQPVNVVETHYVSVDRTRARRYGNAVGEDGRFSDAARFAYYYI